VQGTEEDKKARRKAAEEARINAQQEIYIAEEESRQKVEELTAKSAETRNTVIKRDEEILPDQHLHYHGDQQQEIGCNIHGGIGRVREAWGSVGESSSSLSPQIRPTTQWETLSSGRDLSDLRGLAIQGLKGDLIDTAAVYAHADATALAAKEAAQLAAEAAQMVEAAREREQSFRGTPSPQLQRQEVTHLKPSSFDVLHLDTSPEGCSPAEGAQTQRNPIFVSPDSAAGSPLLQISSAPPGGTRRLAPSSCYLSPSEGSEGGPSPLSAGHTLYASAALLHAATSPLKPPPSPRDRPPSPRERLGGVLGVMRANSSDDGIRSGSGEGGRWVHELAGMQERVSALEQLCGRYERERTQASNMADNWERAMRAAEQRAGTLEAEVLQLRSKVQKIGNAEQLNADLQECRGELRLTRERAMEAQAQVLAMQSEVIQLRHDLKQAREKSVEDPLLQELSERLMREQVSLQQQKADAERRAEHSEERSAKVQSDNEQLNSQVDYLQKQLKGARLLNRQLADLPSQQQGSPMLPAEELPPRPAPTYLHTFSPGDVDKAPNIRHVSPRTERYTSPRSERYTTPRSAWNDTPRNEGSGRTPRSSSQVRSPEDLSLSDNQIAKVLRQNSPSEAVSELLRRAEELRGHTAWASRLWELEQSRSSWATRVKELHRVESLPGSSKQVEAPQIIQRPRSASGVEHIAGNSGLTSLGMKALQMDMLHNQEGSNMGPRTPHQNDSPSRERLASRYGSMATSRF